MTGSIRPAPRGDGFRIDHSIEITLHGALENCLALYRARDQFPALVMEIETGGPNLSDTERIIVVGSKVEHVGLQDIVKQLGALVDEAQRLDTDG